ncbi:DISARM system phospholipase D-like protein DrmC [Anaeromyxobacter oryzisoli]|uniref:DISARM system phospholipase D-like protein DrmC n=1 Tax=Anaeromyxobacter oryzisoli TaxID=2925408 RepID=UPI001F5701E8|nr:DISARM system phospholipase D-like protein DrmC [Anaeromyxobacter sp. SG63]
MSARDHEPVVDAIAAFAADVPHDVLERVCAGLERLELGEDASPWHSAMAELPQPELRIRAADLVAQFNAAAPSAGPRSLAWALRSAEAADRAERARRTLELVWTGPAPDGCVLRRTDQALLEVIGKARRKLLVVSYAAYDVAQVREALLAAEARHVEIIFVMESKEQSGGKVTFDAALALGPLSERAAVYVWPLDRRPRDPQGRVGALHAKCAVADDDVLFVSSANLTGYALTLNMELGVLVTGGELPGRVSRHFTDLIAERVLEDIR